MVRESVRRADESSQAVRAVGAKQVVLPWVLAEVEGVEEGEASNPSGPRSRSRESH